MGFALVLDDIPYLYNPTLKNWCLSLEFSLLRINTRSIEVWKMIVFRVIEANLSNLLLLTTSNLVLNIQESRPTRGNLIHWHIQNWQFKIPRRYDAVKNYCIRNSSFYSYEWQIWKWRANLKCARSNLSVCIFKVKRKSYRWKSRVEMKEHWI